MIPDLSLTGKRWMLRDARAAAPPAILARLAVERRVGLSPPPVSPTIFPDMPCAVSRVHAAMEKKERVGIFGDYDCDGITATAELVRYFLRHGHTPTVFLPHRMRDGYGLKERSIDALAKQGVTLLLTVDTGITAVESIAHARICGMEVIVTDHHHLHAEVPGALAILHPALAPGYPPPFPSGAGVALALVQALEGNDDWPDRDQDLALAMIGTIADLVELTGGNRSIVREGLAALERLRECPLATLVSSTRSGDRPLTSTDIAFRLAPRINAAGRMEDPTIALAAILEGGEALKALEELNVRRQHSMRSFFEEAQHILSLPPRSSDVDLPALPPLLAVASPGFPEGIIGLIAGKITETYGHPSLVATTRDGMCTVSLRSPRSYHITEGLERCQELLLSFGGHAQAAGCTVAADRYEELCRRLNEDIAQHTDPFSLLPSLEIDAVLAPEAVTLSFCERLRALEPFGQGNPEPLFLLRSVRCTQPRHVGADGAHLQTRLAGQKAIGFKLGYLLDALAHPLDAVCRLTVDTWNGYRTPQIIIEDLRPARVGAELRMKNPKTRKQSH